LLNFEHNLERLIREDGFTAESEGLFGRSTMADAIAKRIKGAEFDPADRSLQFLLKTMGTDGWMMEHLDPLKLPISLLFSMASCSAWKQADWQGFQPWIDRANFMYEFKDLVPFFRLRIARARVPFPFMFRASNVPLLFLYPLWNTYGT